MPNVNPPRNGHQAPPVRPAPRRGPARRNRAVVTVAVVSALTGLGLLLGGILGGLVLNAKNVSGGVAFTLASVGALAGAVYGARLANKLARGSRRRFRLSALGTVPGLVAAVGISYLASASGNGLLAVLAIFCPGIGAALGALLAETGGSPAALTQQPAVRAAGGKKGRARPR